MLTYKTKLKFESREVADFWASQMRLVRDCYNFVSTIAFNEQTPLSLKPFHHRMYNAEREAFPSLPAQMCIKVYKQVLSNYRAAKANKHKLEKPLAMKNPSVQLDKRLYSGMTRTSFKLANGNGSKRSVVKFVTYPKFDELASLYRMCDPVLKFDEKNGVFFACVPFLALPTTPCDESVIGVDLGMKRIATLSDGTAITDKKYLANRRRIRHNRRVMQRHKMKSHSARRKLTRLRRKEMNVSKQMCRDVANEILSHNGSVVVIEDLTAIKRETSTTQDGHKRTRHNNAMSQVPFFKLRQILTYKAPLRGKRVETVSPEYTSQEDCRSQSKVGCIRKGCRFYTADGLVFDADWNAAINVRNRYVKHPDSFRLPLDGRLNLIGRRRQNANRVAHSAPCKPMASAVGF